MLVPLFVPLVSLLAVASAQSSNSSSSTAVAAAGSNGYSYIGCWNETTGIAGTSGARALPNGKMVATPKPLTARATH